MSVQLKKYIIFEIEPKIGPFGLNLGPYPKKGLNLIFCYILSMQFHNQRVLEFGQKKHFVV